MENNKNIVVEMLDGWRYEIKDDIIDITYKNKRTVLSSNIKDLENGILFLAHAYIPFSVIYNYEEVNASSVIDNVAIRVLGVYGLPIKEERDLNFEFRDPRRKIVMANLGLPKNKYTKIMDTPICWSLLFCMVDARKRLLNK